MNKCYLIVLCLDNNYYIQLTKSTDGNGYSLRAFETLKEGLDEFESFRNKAKSSDYESHISGSLGIINLRPNIIEVSKDNPEILRKYILEETATTLKGGVFGAFINLVGLKVNKDILELSVCDVANNVIESVYQK